MGGLRFHGMKQQADISEPFDFFHCRMEVASKGVGTMKTPTVHVHLNWNFRLDFVAPGLVYCTAVES